MKLYHRQSIILHLKIFVGQHVYMYMSMCLSISAKKKSHMCSGVSVSVLVHHVSLSVDLPPAPAGIYNTTVILYL